MNTQSSWVLAQLKSGKRLTAAYALKSYGIARLAARIEELRACHDIRTTMVSVRNRRGRVVKVAEYWIGGADV